MSGFWSEGFWISGFWAAGFWGETSEPAAEPAPVYGGLRARPERDIWRRDDEEALLMVIL